MVEDDKKTVDFSNNRYMNAFLYRVVNGLSYYLPTLFREIVDVTELYLFIYLLFLGGILSRPFIVQPFYKCTNSTILWPPYVIAPTLSFSCWISLQDNSGRPVMWENHFCRVMLVFPLSDCWGQHLKAAHDSTRLPSCDQITLHKPDFSPQQLYQTEPT